jgi:ArsR family transcriptional regulator
MNRTIFEIQADFCKVMGNSIRLQILHSLKKGPLSVGGISKETGLSQPVVSRQLSTMRHTGILICHKNGNETIYQLSDKKIGEVCDLVRKILVEQIRVQSLIYK